MRTVSVGLVGFGTVGSGVVRLLRDRGPELARRVGVDLRLVRVVDKDLVRDRGVTLPAGVLTDRLEAALDDPEVSVVIELVGGTTVAREVILKALVHGKSVVTANKALLAVHGREILECAAKHHVSVSFEASTAGGVPVIMALRDGLVANRIESIMAILNGTCNYILTRMTEGRVGYAQALREAQERGYAEADPSLDVDGVDSAHKLAILARIGFGVDFDFAGVCVRGIRDLDLMDIEYAGELGYAVKLLAVGRRDGDVLELRVHPALVGVGHVLSGVKGANNAVLIHGDAVGDVLLHGAGAGQMPTASAVVSDLVDVALGRAQLTFDHFRIQPAQMSAVGVTDMDRTRGSYYVRFSAQDRAGVLAGIAGALGKQEISILSVIQKEGRCAGSVPIVMMTDVAPEKRLRAALTEIDQMPFVTDKSVWIRVER